MLILLDLSNLTTDECRSQAATLTLMAGLCERQGGDTRLDSAWLRMDELSRERRDSLR